MNENCRIHKLGTDPEPVVIEAVLHVHAASRVSGAQGLHQLGQGPGHGRRHGTERRLEPELLVRRIAQQPAPRNQPPVMTLDA
jgi:hypothetical protein